MVRVPCTALSTVPALTAGGVLLQWPDSVLSRAAVRAAVLGLDAVVPFAIIWLGAAYACRPAPPAVVATVALSPDGAADFLLRYRMLFTALTAWAALELAWYIVARIGLALLDKSRSRNSSRPRQQSPISSEERWRLWKSMVESSKDPAQWLKTAFLPKPHRHAPRGADDPAFAKLKLESVGRTNIEEVNSTFVVVLGVQVSGKLLIDRRVAQTQFIAHYLFESRLRDLKPRSLARSELDAMILLLEARMTLWRAEQQSSATSSQSSSSSSGGGGGNAPVAPFRFLRGRSPHRLFNLADEPLRAGHHPLVFYAAMAGISQIAYLALYLAGFRYYAGSGTVSFFSFFSLASPPHHHHRRGFAHTSLFSQQWPFPLRLMRASTKSLEAALDPAEAARMGDPRLAARVGYWYKPASQQAQEDDAKPVR